MTFGSHHQVDDIISVIVSIPFGTERKCFFSRYSLSNSYLHFIIGSFFNNNSVSFVTSKIKHREAKGIMVSIVIFDCSERYGSRVWTGTKIHFNSMIRASWTAGWLTGTRLTWRLEVQSSCIHSRDMNRILGTRNKYCRYVSRNYRIHLDNEYHVACEFHLLCNRIRCGNHSANKIT